MPAITENINALKNYRNDIGIFDKTTKSNDSIIAKHLAAGKNIGLINPPMHFKEHEGLDLHQLTNPAGVASDPQAGSAPAWQELYRRPAGPCFG